MTTRQGERLFTAGDMDALFTPGVVTTSTRRPRAWYPESDPAAAVTKAVALARRSWLDAVTLVPKGARLSHAGLALVFAEHLRQIRSVCGLYGACVTSPTAPPLPSPSLLRMPHLVTAEGPDPDRWTDMTVWEVMTHKRFDAWLQRSPVVMDGVEEQVPRLLALRRTVREGTLPDTPETRMLRELLDTRYLSIRLVLEHRPLFNALLERHFKEAHT